jgi:hypothetical protein
VTTANATEKATAKDSAIAAKMRFIPDYLRLEFDVQIARPMYAVNPSNSAVSAGPGPEQAAMSAPGQFGSLTYCQLMRRV